MLWFDAEANFQRFSTQAGIIAMLDKTQEAGFNKIVVDVKPVEGDVLYKSEFMTQATTIGSVNVADDVGTTSSFSSTRHINGT